MNYEILFQGDLQEDERIQRDFRVLLATRAGSQPVDRDLGIDWSCLDGPPETAEVMFRMEVEIKTEKYLPDLEIDRIDFIREPGRSEAPDFLSQKGGDGPWTESERSWRVIQRSALLIIWVFLTFWHR